ncbi:MAG TPA: APC family permease [Savagea sp.]
MTSTHQQLSRSLSLPAVVMNGMAFMALTTVFSTYGIAAEISNGMVAGAYLVALVVMMFTAHSYGQMARAFPMSGSAYTYAQHAINPFVGFLVGWAILMDYLFIPMVNFLLFGIFFSAAIPQIPEFVWILALIVIVTYVNAKGVKFSSRINMIIISLSALFLLLFGVLAIRSILSGTGTGMLVNLDPIFDPSKSPTYLIAGAALLCFSFLGFDAVTTFSEEVKDPKKNVPRAIFLVTIIGGLIFTSAAYFAHNVWPDFTTFKDPDAAANEIFLLIGGSAMQAAFLTITALVVFGSASASQASAARVLYAMGRDGQLPQKFFGTLNEKTKVPVNNIVLIGVISLSALFVSLSFIATFINFGALLSFTVVNLSVIIYYYVKQKRRSPFDTVKFLIIPAMGALMTLALLVNLDMYSKVVGSIWFLLGVIYLGWMTKGFRQPPPTLHTDPDSGVVEETIVSKPSTTP